MQTILCYGDSNTWGYIPATAERYPPHVRWTGVLQAALGEGFRVIEAGLNARTTVHDDPFAPDRNGLRTLNVALTSHKPLTLVVLALGINDLKMVNAHGAARGAEMLIQHILHADACYPGSSPIFAGMPQVLLVAPPPLHPDFEKSAFAPVFRYGHVESCRLADAYAAVAARQGVGFLDAGAVCAVSPVDGLHLEPPAHKALGEAIARAVRQG